MNLAHISNHCAVVGNESLASRVEEALSCLRIIMRLFLHSHFLQEFLYYALHGEEIAVSVHSQSELLTLVRKRRKSCLLQVLGILLLAYGQVNGSQLVESYVLISPVVVCGERV